MKLDINNSKRLRQFLNNTWIKTAITEDIRKYLELNENEIIIY